MAGKGLAHSDARMKQRPKKFRHTTKRQREKETKMTQTVAHKANEASSMERSE